MKLLVCGGMGFIGSAFIRNHLSKNPKDEIINLDNLTTGSNIKNLEKIDESNYQFINGDIKNHEAVNKITNDIDVIVNFAAETHVDRSISNPKQFLETNILGTYTLLEAAKKRGDKLILGLNTDRSVSAIKGPTRPVVNESDRARVLAALESVDAVILFDEDTPIKLINVIKPNVIAKGSDYTADEVVGGKEVKSWGGEIALINLVEGRSTSNIIQKLNG